MKKTGSADFCEDQIHILTNFAVITGVVRKRVHCKSEFISNVEYHKSHKIMVNMGTFVNDCQL